MPGNDVGTTWTQSKDDNQACSAYVELIIGLGRRMVSESPITMETGDTLTVRNLKGEVRVILHRRRKREKKAA